MKIRLEDRLPFVTVKLGRGTEELVLERVLLDTGSATTMFAVDEIAILGIVPGLDLETAMRERGWPAAEQVAVDPYLGRLALECFAYDLLLEWLSDGSSEAGEWYVLNTVDHVAIQDGVIRIEGTARRGGIPVRYQDV